MPPDPDPAPGADDRRESASEPLSVAIINDFDLVVNGLAAMLAPFTDRVRVVDLTVGETSDHCVDVVLVDTFAALEDAIGRGLQMVGDGRARCLVVYTWDVDSAHRAVEGRHDVAGVVAKTATSDELVEVIEKVAAGSWGGAGPGALQGTRRPVSLLEPLSDRELEVIVLMADGLTNREIAERMGVTLETVKSFARRAFPKIGARNRAQAAAWATDRGLTRQLRSS